MRGPLPPISRRPDSSSPTWPRYACRGPGCRPLAALKGAGAAGLLLGLLGLRLFGIAAAVGLVLFFTGALATHVGARAFRNIAFPGAYFALAIASAALAVAAH
jgi:DoxX-like protein